MNSKVAAFTRPHKRHLPELLHERNCSIAPSTCQPKKMIPFSALNGKDPLQLGRTFQKPTGDRNIHAEKDHRFPHIEAVKKQVSKSDILNLNWGL